VWTAGVAAVSVLYMAFVVPLGSAPDETQHAFRAYQLSLGQLFPTLVTCATHHRLLPCHGDLHSRLLPKRRAGGFLPATLVQVFSQLYHDSHTRTGFPIHFKAHDYAPLIGASLGVSRTTYTHFENTALYSPINYLPEIVVFWVARNIGQPVIATLFAARLLGGMIWAALITAAVAIVPRWKWLISMVVLVPTALAQGAAISADSATLGVVALTLAYALWLADRRQSLGRRDVAMLAALGLVIGLMKLPLVLVLVPILALVWQTLGSGRARRRRIGAIAAPGLIAAAVWNIASNPYFVPYRDVVYHAAQRVHVNQAGQEHYLLSHFYDLPALLWHTAIHGHLFKINEIVAQIGEVGLPEWFAIVWLVLFVLLACGSIEGGELARAARGWIGGTLVVYFLATAVALYITWSAVGSGNISGMHGRYFTLVLVLAAPLFAGLGRRRLRISPRVVGYAAMAISAVSACTTFAYTSVHYYGEPPWQAFGHVTSVLF
jgi:uncharacterized membrane protein